MRPGGQPNAEIFSPPYLFKGPRPVMTSAPAVIPYATGFQVATPDAARIGAVSLIALGAVTHAFNENQRFVPLTFQQGSGTMTVQGPVDGNTAPPGPYMLFLVDTTGVPSVAAMVRLPAPGEDIQPPTPPTNLVAAPSVGSVSLTWTASTDNIGVSGYSVYRSTASGFTPAPANRIGQASSNSYVDTSLSAAGTYYYLVTAQDAKGNSSPPSNEASAAVTLDTSPPSVAITSPGSSSTVSGVTTVTASASDNVTVAGVQFLLDGAPLGAEVSSSGPTYSVTWITTTAANGSHTLSARARDGAGNTGLSASVGVTVANTVSGPLAAYSFDEGSGTTVSDRSGHALTGTVVGAAWATGRYGKALSFNGSTSYVDLGNPAALQLTGSMTIEAWINAAANPPDDGQIVAKSNGAGWQFKTSPDTGPQTFGMAVSPNSGTSTQRYSSTVRSLNTWYHVAGVYDAAAGTLSTYVNGALDNGTLSGTIPAAQFNQSVNVNIGRRTGGFYFNGLIDEVRIYNRALTQPEIQADMNAPIGSAPPPPDTTPPAVSLTAPGNGATVTGTTTLTASASDNVGVVGVQFLLDGAALGAEVTGSGPTYTYSWNTASVGLGPHTLSARARDAAGNTALATTVNVTVAAGDTTPPTVSLTSPVAGSDLAGTVGIVASATDNTGVAGVQFLVDGANLGSEVTGPGPAYSFTWNTATSGNGAHTLSARARDAAGNSAVSANVAITVTNSAPGGLLLGYGFNEGSGTTVHDSSPNAITGTLSGATWTSSGKYGAAVSFNGTNNYVDLGNPAALKGTGSMTWSAWVYATGNPPDDGQIIAKSNNNSGWQLKTSPDTGPHTFAIGVSGSSGIAQRYSNAIRSLNTWYHLAGVYDAAARTLDIYVNGALDNGVLRGTIPAAMTVPNINVNIGRRTGGFYFKGIIDEIHVYNRALSPAEIQAVMNDPLP